LIKQLNRGQGGFFDTTGTFVGIDSVAGLWIANESTVNIPSYAWMVTFENDWFGYTSYITLFNKTFGAFVRCVKGEAYTIVSSSSETDVPSSSSKADLTLTVAEGCESATRENWKYLNPDVEYGCIKDSRDGRYYKTLVLDDQMWIAENLRYVPENKKIQSWCYSEKDGECDEFGRYYHGNAVAANPGICPEGFHAATDEEFEALSAVDVADFSVTVKFGGYFNQNGICTLAGEGTYFWTTTEEDASRGFVRNLFSDAIAIDKASVDKRFGLSVRCVQE